MLPYEKIKLDILTGALKPGERLRETVIAKELNVSRTPIREAIRLLAAENLVTFSPNKGATVKEFTIEDVKHAFDLRALLEGHAACLAAQNHDEILLDKLDKCRREYEEKVNRYIQNSNKSDAELMNLIASNGLFHDTIMKLAKNKYIPNLVSSLLTLPMTFQSFYWFDEKEFQFSIEVHNHIAKAIYNREAEQARVIMSAHVLHGRDYVLKSVFNSTNHIE